MSTWGSGPFDNDYAMDWVQDLLETKSLELIETTLDNVVDGVADNAGELEAPFAAEALAAIDVIARLMGARDDATEDDEIDAWVARCKRKVNALLIGKAHQAIARILSEQSELNQLWRGSGDQAGYDDWRAGVAALEARLPA